MELPEEPLHSHKNQVETQIHLLWAGAQITCRHRPEDGLHPSLQRITRWNINDRNQLYTAALSEGHTCFKVQVEASDSLSLSKDRNVLITDLESQKENLIKKRCGVCSESDVCELSEHVNMITTLMFNTGETSESRSLRVSCVSV